MAGSWGACGAKYMNRGVSRGVDSMNRTASPASTVVPYSVGSEPYVFTVPSSVAR